MKILKLLLVMSVMLAGSSEAWAVKQVTTCVRGTVLDKSDASGMEFVTVALMKADSTIVSGTVTGADGCYELTSVPYGNYIVSASMIGYTTVSRNIAVSGGPLTLEPFVLEEDMSMLQSAVLTEKVKLVEMKLDKIVMNVSQSAFSQGSNALELMRKAPGVIIDKDGNITLNGKAVSVWVDGRPSYLDGKSLEALLRSTDGSNIDRIELMPNPSSKYDAEGQGGIINIRTKKSFISGLNGSLGIDGGGMYFSSVDRSFGQESTFANFAYRSSKNNTFVNLYQGTYTQPVEFEMNTVMPLEGGVFRNETMSLIDNRGWNGSFKFGNDWFANDRNTFGFIITGARQSGCMMTPKEIGGTRIYLGDVMLENTVSEIKNKSITPQINGNLNFTHVFDESRSAEITANIDWYHNAGVENENNVVTGQTAMNASDYMVRNIDLDQKVDIYSAKLDYQTVLWQAAMVEAGAKWALSKTDYDMARTETGEADIFSRFNYDENIGAAYATVAGALGPKLTYKAGLRAEYTSSVGNWISSGKKTSRHYLDFFPTVYAGYAPDENWRLSLVYTRRISRPGYYHLNPVENYVSSHSSIIGDPELLPEYSDQIVFQGGWGQYLSFASGYEYVGQQMVQAPSIKANGDEVLIWQNFGKRHLGFIQASVSELPLTKWLSWTMNVQGMYINNVDPQTGFTNGKPSANMYTCFTVMLPGDWKVQMDGTWQSSLAYGYFRLKPVYYSDLAVRKNMMDGRMTLSADLTDVFRTRTQHMDVLGLAENYECYIGQKYYVQKIKFGLSWNFGKAHQTKHRNVGNLEEMDRVGK